MAPWELVAFVLLGVLVVLLPVGVIGVFASKLVPQQRAGFLVLYAGAISLLCVTAADLNEVISNRAVIDLVLIIGGLAVGLYAGTLLRIRWPNRRPGKTKPP